MRNLVGWENSDIISKPWPHKVLSQMGRTRTQSFTWMLGLGKKFLLKLLFPGKLLFQLHNIHHNRFLFAEEKLISFAKYWGKKCLENRTLQTYLPIFSKTPLRFSRKVTSFYRQNTYALSSSTRHQFLSSASKGNLLIRVRWVALLMAKHLTWYITVHKTKQNMPAWTKQDMPTTSRKVQLLCKSWFILWQKWICSVTIYG